MTEQKEKNHKQKSHPSRRRRRQSNHSQNRNHTKQNHKKNPSNQSNTKRSQKHSKWNKFRLSEHFMKRDFDSRRKGCPCDGSLRISLGLVGIIEAIRAKVNKRIDIVTGFYCPECRERQYGIKRDFHHMGIAADIRVQDMSIVELFLIAESFPEIKGLGINFDDNHVHIDTRKEDQRECWVEKNNEWIKLTEENRNEFLNSEQVHDSDASHDSDTSHDSDASHDSDQTD